MFDPVKHSLQNTLDFKPPLPNAFIQKVFQLILPFICDKNLGGLSIHLSHTSLKRLQAIQGQRCLLLPNHPSEWDPCVVFDIGRRLKENFYFVAAREVFDYSYGLRGWFFQKLGVYSLVRGGNDRKSLKTSIEILSENKGRLVIFVEGEISQQNESLLPLESGVIQLAFMALNDCYKEIDKDFEKLPSLYICPTSLRYEYTETGLIQSIELALGQLEQATNCQTQGSIFERLSMLSAYVLEQAAAQIGYPMNPDIALADNVKGLSHLMLTKLEHLINLSSQEEASYLDRVRAIRNKVDSIVTQGEKPLSLYQDRLHAQQRSVLKNYYQNLGRVVNFVAIYDGYLQANMSTARQVELIRRLEKEVFGAARLVAPRTAHVQVSEPVDLKPHFLAFLDDKRATVQKIAHAIEDKLYDGIHATTG